ncbi:MAG TPA: IPT/TIG domain-containing protein [Candidatus Dormibacteraeota bacterium]|nr:IPT/TIG domain-containing protein [Candidatus Dormibacteraeota bacterium]
MSPRPALVLFFLLAFSVTTHAQTAPSITSLSPQRGPVGTLVTISGQNFGASQGSVLFNGTTNVYANPSTWTDTQIVVPVPDGATTGAIYVITSIGNSNGVYFAVGTLPSINNMDPQRGPSGTTVTITGQYFGATQGNGTVLFSGTTNVYANPSTWSDTQIVVSVPDGATTSQVYVGTSAGWSNGVYFAVGALPTITNLSPQSGPIGALVTLTGQYFGVTQGGSFVTFSGTTNVLASPSIWTDTQIVMPVPPGATTSQIYVTTSAGGSNGTYFAVLPTPAISSLSSNSGVIGSTVTITGTNFGSSHGSSTVTFNGTPATSIPTWSETQVVVTIPPGATTGNVVLTAQNVPSNGVNFTVFTAAPPSISASASPVPNANGWNNSPVLVTFICSAGGLSIAKCPAPQLVTTEGANQVVSGTAIDTAGNSATAIVTLNIERTPPTLTVSSPADQFVTDSASIAVSGASANSLTNINSVACNGTAAASASGSFSCNISLNPGVNLVMITASDAAGNIAGTRLHVIYGAALPAPISLQITPANANVLVGATQQFTAVDQLGRPRTDVSWSVDNTSIATITTDSSPTLTGVAAGTITLTASLGTISVNAQVNVLAGTSLPVGTALWSAPLIPGFTTQKIVQAVPTSNGTPDLYAIDQDQNSNVLVRAFASSGQQFWQLALPQAGFSGQAMGDNSGGLVLGAGPGIINLDGQSGATAFTAPYSPLAIGQDGSVIAVDANRNLLKLDGLSGQGLVAYSGPLSVTTVQTGTCVNNAPVVSEVQNSATPNAPGNVIVDANGNAFFTVWSEATTGVLGCVEGDPTQSWTNSFEYSLVELAPNGTAITTNLPVGDAASVLPSVLAPDGNGGVLVAWATGQYPNFSPKVFASSVGTAYASPVQGGMSQLVLGENSTAFATDGSSVASFNPSSGSTNWTYAAPSQNFFSLIAASAQSGLVGKLTDQNGFNSVIRFDQSGVSANDTWTANAAANLNVPGLINVRFLSSDAFLATKSNSNSIALFSSGSEIDWVSPCIWCEGDPANPATPPSYHLPLKVFQVQGTSVNSQDTIASQVGKAQKVWTGKWKNLFLDWDGQVQTTPVCDASISGTDCANVTTHLDFISFDILCGPSTGQQTLLARFPNTLNNQGITILYTGILANGRSNPAGWTPGVNGTCFPGHLIVMSQSAFDRDLAHEIGHALSLPDRTSALVEPGSGKINLMCSAASACSDGHAHGEWLDSDQLDQAWHGGVLALRKVP